MSIYDKPIASLETSDLQELLTENAVENLRLEFKLQDPSKDETLKKLSSFANTFGGYLIIGAQANSSGRLQGLPGIDSIPGFKQRIVQWCYEGVSPLLQPFVSDPIASPSDPKKVCYLIYVEESQEAPHFLNSRKGVYIRTDEFSQRFEPKLATFDEIQHLVNRRALAVERRHHLLDRANARFETYVRQEYDSLPYTTGTIGATLKLVVVPRFPVAPLIEHQKLIDLVQKVRISWRQVGFPRVGTYLNQHESVIILGAGSGFSLIETNVWGQLYYALELERQEGDSKGIHLHAFLGNFLAFLEYARQMYTRIGFNGSLQFLVRLERILHQPFLYSSRYGEIQENLASRLDDVVEFEETFSSEAFQTSRDIITSDLLRTIFFALNWAEIAANKTALTTFLTYGYEYNFWARAKP